MDQIERGNYKLQSGFEKAEIAFHASLSVGLVTIPDAHGSCLPTSLLSAIFLRHEVRYRVHFLHVLAFCAFSLSISFVSILYSIGSGLSSEYCKAVELDASMGSIARRLGRWKTTDKELERTVGEDTRVLNRQSVDSQCSALSGLESQSSRSTQFTRSSRSKGSSRSTLSEPDSLSKCAPGLHHKMSSVFSYFSETIRSTTSIFHLEQGTAPSERAEFESPKKELRPRSSTLAVSRPSEAQIQQYKTTELETPKKHRRYSSVISSVRSRRSFTSPRGRESQNCAMSTPTRPVRTFQEQPPKLDVKIPNSFLDDERSRSTVALEASSTEPLSELFKKSPRKVIAPCVRMPQRELCHPPLGMDSGFETEDDFPSPSNSGYCDRVIVAPNNEQSMLGNDGHSIPDENNARMKASCEVLPANLDHATLCTGEAESIPSSLLELTHESPLTARRGLELGVKSASDDLALAHSPAPHFPPDSSDSSPLRNDLPQTVSSQDAYSLLISRHRQSCSDAKYSHEAMDCCDRLLSPGAYDADMSSCGTSPEHPSMGDRVAIAQRRADREKRYLETTLEGPDTESDDNSQSALELTRVTAACDNSQRCSDTMRNNSANAKDFNWPLDSPPATRDNSGVVDAVDVRLRGELPAAKSPTLDRSLIAKGEFRYAVEAIERAPGDTGCVGDLPYAVEAIERTPGYMLSAPTEDRLEVERPASSSIRRSVPSDPKSTMMPMRVAADSVVTLEPKRSDDEGFLVMSSTNLSADARLELTNTGLIFENALRAGPRAKSGAEKVPRLCRDTKFGQTILFPRSRSAEHREAAEDWMNDYFEIAAEDTTYENASLDSSSQGFPLQNSSTSRRASWEERMASRHEAPIYGSPASSLNSDESPSPFPNTELGLKRYELQGAKPTSHISHGSDDKLIPTFIQESPESRASPAPEDACRSNVPKTVCFAKDVEIIDRDSQFNPSPRKTSPARPAKRLSGAETAKKVQKDLEVRNEASNQRLCQRLQEQPGSPPEENEASWPEKPRWRVP